MSVEEFIEWGAFYEVEPFGTPVEDDRMRNLLALTYSGLGGKEDVQWLDRDPEWTRRLREMALPPLEDSIEAYFEARLKAQGPTEPEPDPEPVEVPAAKPKRKRRSALDPVPVEAATAKPKRKRRKAVAAPK